MAWERRAAPARQQRKAIAQTRGYQLNPKCGSARRREFNGKRYAVEVATDRCDRRQVCGV